MQVQLDIIVPDGTPIHEVANVVSIALGNEYDEHGKVVGQRQLNSIQLTVDD